MADVVGRARRVARAAALLIVASLLVVSADRAPAFAAASTVSAMLAQVNALRARMGLRPLAPDARLMRAAQRQSEALARSGVLTHGGPGGDLPTRMLRVGYRFGLVGENLASGMADPVKVLRAWLNSPGHRANLLRRDVSTVGIGYSKSGRAFGNYWTIILAEPAT